MAANKRLFPELLAKKHPRSVYFPLFKALSIQRRSSQWSDITERKATYVFQKVANGNWLCAIDNSYGHEVVQKDA